MMSTTPSPHFNGHHHPHENYDIDDETRRIAQLSNTALENMAQSFWNESAELSMSLTQQLSTTASGQHLLHTASTLSTSSIPPNLHALLQHHTPLLQVCEQYEHTLRHDQCDVIQQQMQQVRQQIQRYQHIQRMIQIVQDLRTVEKALSVVNGGDAHVRSVGDSHTATTTTTTTTTTTAHPEQEEEEEDEDGNTRRLEDAQSWERTAMVVATLTETLRRANETILQQASTSTSTSSSSTTNTHPTTLEFEHCLWNKCAHRIRRAETKLVAVLLDQYTVGLQHYTAVATAATMANTTTAETSAVKNDDSTIAAQSNPPPELGVPIMVVGHVMRGLLLLGRTRDLAQIFCQIVVQPRLARHVTPRNLDQGGARGECHHLPVVIQSMVHEMATLYRPLLSVTEHMFQNTDDKNNNSNDDDDDDAKTTTTVEVDLMTEGLWVPLIQTFLTDATLRRCIFSPGLARRVQTNYQTLVEETLYHWADRILGPHAADVASTTTTSSSTALTTANGEYGQYYHPLQYQLSREQIRHVQMRINQHPVTTEFMKRWNLPIYYQLRFGECSSRINQTIEQTKCYGWSVTSQMTTNSDASSPEGGVDLESRYANIRQRIGLELLLFIDVYDAITTFWQSHVFIKPLTNRFLRGTIQVIGRILAFVKEGMDGTLLFGAEQEEKTSNDGNDNQKITDDNTSNIHKNHDSSDLSTLLPPSPRPMTIMSRKPYCWGESVTDVAAVMWELSILETALRENYVSVVCDALRNSNRDGNDAADSEASFTETTELVNDIMKEASEQISPIIEHGWNELIVNMLTAKCSGPLGAVKGVAATYRMTNRPPPTMSSPFVITILRPLREFDTEFHNRVPTQIGTTWKLTIVSTISDRYAVAVDDLIATVQRAEESLLKRKGGRATAASVRSGGVTMTDGEKVKLQLFLDYQTYVRCVQEVGIDPLTINGVVKLGALTKEGETLQQVLPK